MAFDSICNDPELGGMLSLYFSTHGFNSFFLLSDLVFIQGVAEKSGEPDLEAAQKKLMGEVSRASSNLVEFARAFVAAAWLRHFGEDIIAKDIVSVTDAPNIDDVRLPFFVEIEAGDETSGDTDA
jgi:hypothetical protein